MIQGIWMSPDIAVWWWRVDEHDDRHCGTYMLHSGKLNNNGLCWISFIFHSTVVDVANDSDVAGWLVTSSVEWNLWKKSRKLLYSQWHSQQLCLHFMHINNATACYIHVCYAVVLFFWRLSLCQSACQSICLFAPKNAEKTTDHKLMYFGGIYVMMNRRSVIVLMTFELDRRPYRWHRASYALRRYSLITFAADLSSFLRQSGGIWHYDTSAAMPCSSFSCHGFVSWESTVPGAQCHYASPRPPVVQVPLRIQLFAVNYLSSYLLSSNIHHILYIYDATSNYSRSHASYYQIKFIKFFTLLLIAERSPRACAISVEECSVEGSV